MPRRLKISLLGALACLAAATPLAADAQSSRTPLAARVKTCSPSAHVAVFTASMPRWGGASVLAVRFDLSARTGHGAWRAVKATGFGSWLKSAAGATGFVYDKRVEGLTAGRAYRVTVRYRWLDADGDVVRRATRTSASCTQTDRRPNLEPGTIAVKPTSDGQATYVVGVRNTGRGDVEDPFSVSLTSDGAPLGAQAVSTLDAGHETTVTFSGPRCTPGAQLSVSVDTEGTVDESDEDDDTVVMPCPALTTTAP
jgi:hypothetical protein